MLTDTQIRQAKPGPKVIKLSDAGGLQLWIKPSGHKSWWTAFRLDGKQATVGHGPYPEITLAEARERHREARTTLARGVDPRFAKKATAAAAAAVRSNTFAAVAQEVIDRKTAEGRAPKTTAKLGLHFRLLKALHDWPVRKLQDAPLVIVDALRPLERAGKLETLERAGAFLSETFRLAIATGRATSDPWYALRKGVFRKKDPVNRPAIIEREPFGGLMRAIAGYDGADTTRLAIELLALTFVRPGELRMAEWAEVDEGAAVWTIPAEKMKDRKRPHRVPLSRQALAIVSELRERTGAGRYIFPSLQSRGRPMSGNTINAAIRRLGYDTQAQHCAHGFRSSASSMLNATKKFSPDAIERQLAHVDQNEIRGIYARDPFWDERVELMQYWADLIDAMRAGGKVVTFSLDDGEKAAQ